ncbi:serine protease [uncultured Porphyromonas sp.]|uniref:serine protease n=1 Tax=uncultured Porphyromonas sp. TaxID=159274 RepID=UPI0028059024|nr:serine protease [uncultured Porphyromonas sp.]
MNKRSVYWCAIALLLIVTGCAKKKTPQELFDMQRSGVVLILNKFYYEIQLSNGNSFYFTNLDDEGDFVNFTTDLPDVEKSPAILNGTGFFIDNTGRILTNRHVVAPQIDRSTVKSNMNALIAAYVELVEAYQEQLSEKYQKIQSYKQESLYVDEYGNVDSYLPSSEIDKLSDELDDLKEEYAQAESLKGDLRKSILSEHFTVKLHSTIGIAYDGDMVTEWDDFMKNPCQVLKVSSDDNSDLALLQLESQSTPEDKYIFDVSNYSADANESLQINQPLYMIGYNYGIGLAKTNKGIYAQFTSGALTQNPDGDRIVYSIPAVQGSSGSPVIDENGDLVAVNFAALNGSDNFNFGVPMIRILTFLR